VLIDNFSKWIEYMPLVKASSKKAVKFLDQVIHRFSIPKNIITDLGTQFTGNTFWDFCDERSIIVKYVSVAHPRANGQVERDNGMILDALKKRMYRENNKAPGRWIKELPAVVWGLRTQPSRNTGVSPYFMVYGAEAVLPADIEFQSPRVENYNEDQATEQQELEMNCVEEQQLDSYICMVKYLAVLHRYYNKNVQGRFFVVGDMVLKWKTSQDGIHKLATPWEGPYIVKVVT
jgi:transposase InsO family protein